MEHTKARSNHCSSYTQDNFSIHREDPLSWDFVDFSSEPSAIERFLTKVKRLIKKIIRKLIESNERANVIHNNITRQKEEHFRRNWYWTR